MNQKDDQASRQAFMLKRSGARELVFLSIYASILSGESVDLAFQESKAQNKYDKSYARKISGFYQENQQQIKANLAESVRLASSISMTPVEESILLMAATELMFSPGTPFGVVINESIELAKRYGNKGGYRLVNAVLDALKSKLPSQGQGID